MFFFIRRLGPSIYCIPPKYIGNISQTPKNICNFGLPKIISPSCTLTLRKPLKSLKWIEMTSKTSPILLWYIHKIFIPPKIMIFLKPPKNIEIQDFESPKMVPAYVYIWKSQPPPSPPPTHTHILGASGCEKRTLQKIRLRKWHQLQLKYNSERASKWS